MIKVIVKHSRQSPEMIKPLLLLVIPGLGGERVSNVVPMRHGAYLKGQGEGHGPKLFDVIILGVTHRSGISLLTTVGSD